MDWHRRNRSLLYFIVLVIILILLAVWVGENLKKHIDSKMPDLGLLDESLMKKSTKSIHETKAC